VTHRTFVFEKLDLGNMNPEQIKKMIQEESAKVFDQKMKSVEFQNFKTPRHEHNGKDAPRINQADIASGKSAVGSITMSSNQRYTLGLTFNPSQLLFFGVAYNTSTGERVNLTACARFGTSYYFQPQSGSSAREGGIALNVVQGGNYFYADNGTTTFRAAATEGHLANATDTTGGVVARAKIQNLSTQASLDYPDGTAPITGKYGDRSTTGYGNGFVYVDVTLSSGWAIAATFIVS